MRLTNSQLNSYTEILTKQELQVIKKRFGLDGFDEMTPDEISEQLEIGIQDVRQIEASALAKLRRLPLAQQLRDDYLR